MMKKEMDIEPRGFQADPCFENSDIIKNADVKKFNRDKFSFMDYRDVRKKGYAKLFKKSFAKLYNFFALEKDSPAINKGVKIPDEWPHTGIVKDSAPDIGAFEFDAVNGALLKSKKNVRSGFWSILGL
jgi:hypothetical protein